jgi:hypothetical protein
MNRRPLNPACLRTLDVGQTTRGRGLEHLSVPGEEDIPPAWLHSQLIAHSGEIEAGAAFPPSVFLVIFHGTEQIL